MKRKYYLRGLGMGILVTALVFVITKPSKMTDEEIINRAEELGYVKAEEKDVSPSISIKELMETGTPVPTEVVSLTETPVPTPTKLPEETPEPTNEPIKTITPEATQTPTPEPVEEPTVTPTPTAVPTLTVTPTPTATPVPTATAAPTKKPTPKPTAAASPTAVPTRAPEPTGEPSEEVITATIRVERGNTAKAVCDKIEKAGIVEDGDDLKNYIVRNQLADFINVGTYTLSSDMSYEEIASVLTER
ncbi:MAG: hypothetical protein J6K04_09885 [Lachnospiraceae bacterium]|nr:hypothetical protein [Lachnospiraceae bacterium]